VGARVVVSLEGQIVTEVELTQPVTLVGRHPACDICIDHPAVSGRHMLFRTVNTTVYVEDLASTNGVKVNGHSTANQVVHHLDLIEVGKHKLHFFDDSMLAGGAVANLESTVHTDFERTMLVSHAPAPQAPRQANAREADVDLSRTMAISRDPSRAGATQEVVRTHEPAAANAATLGLRRLSGDRAGELVPLDKANTMLGEAGGDSALVVRRGESFMLARFGGASPRLNRQELGPGAHPIAARDVIEVGNAKFEVVQVRRENQ
jgi:pSer/pThr/pTyr-binding forkhead associated (FHA) protein